MKASIPCVLAINGGSSSIKFALFALGATLKRILIGKIEGIGQNQGIFTARGAGLNENFSRPLVAADHATAVSALIDWLLPQIDYRALAAIGHRWPEVLGADAHHEGTRGGIAPDYPLRSRTFAGRDLIDRGFPTQLPEASPSCLFRYGISSRPAESGAATADPASL